jgi:hypothetical protein
MMLVSNGKSIFTAPAGRPQGSAGIHFWVFSASTFRPQKMPGYPHNTVLVHWFMHSPSTGSVDKF